MKRKNLLLAGSHAGATATAVVREIIKRGLPWDITWIGKKWATEEKNSKTLEYNTLPKLGVKFLAYESGKVQTKFTRHTIGAFLAIPLGFITAGYYVVKIHPDLILTFGGAAGAEAAFWGWIMRIPVIVHEQTAAAGRANIFSSHFARIIAISRESSKKYFDNNKIVVTGNPINPKIAKTVLSTRSVPKTLFITGGSRGSVRINDAVKPILKDLLDKYEVILQAGEGNTAQFENVDSRLRVYGQIDSDEWIEVLSKADIVVSRAGANVVSELIALKKPCLLIPIPWSYLNEQENNARFANEYGIARILTQDKLTPENLTKEISNLRGQYTTMIRRLGNKPSPDLDAAKKVVDILEKHI